MVTCVESARAAGMPVEGMQRSHSGLRGEVGSEFSEDS